MPTEKWLSNYFGSWWHDDWFIEKYKDKYFIFDRGRNLFKSFDTFEEAVKYCEENLNAD